MHGGLVRGAPERRQESGVGPGDRGGAEAPAAQPWQFFGKAKPWPAQRLRPQKNPALKQTGNLSGQDPRMLVAGQIAFAVSTNTLTVGAETVRALGVLCGARWRMLAGGDNQAAPPHQ